MEEYVLLEHVFLHICDDVYFVSIRIYIYIYT